MYPDEPAPPVVVLEDSGEPLEQHVEVRARLTFAQEHFAGVHEPTLAVRT